VELFELTQQSIEAFLLNIYKCNEVDQGIPI